MVEIEQNYDFPFFLTGDIHVRDGRRGGAEHVAARRRRKAYQGQRGPGERSRQEPLLRVSFLNLFFVLMLPKHTL